MTDISTYHLAGHPELYEPSRNNAFEFQLNPLLNDLYPAGVKIVKEDDIFRHSADIISLSVSEASVPHFDLDVISVKRGNSTMKFAGTPSFSDGSLKCNDYVGARTKDILMAWQALAYDVKNDVVHLAGNYKYDCKLVEYTPDFSEVVRTWTLKGCWVKNLSEGNFSHESQDKRTIDVTIVFDRAEIEIPTEEAE